MDNSSTNILTLYSFEYRLIPWLIDQTHKNVSMTHEFVNYMANVDWILNCAVVNNDLQCDFDCSVVKTTVISPDENTHVIVYTFPTPNKVPLAKYGAIVIKPDTCVYFTLEKTYNMGDEEDAPWILGQTLSNGCHTNFGEVNDCATPEDFATITLNRLSEKNPNCFFKSLFKRLFGM